MINTNCGKPFQLTIILASSSESKFEFFLLVFAFGIFKFWIWILNLHFVITRVRLWYPHTGGAPLVRVVLANHEIAHHVRTRGVLLRFCWICSKMLFNRIIDVWTAVYCMFKRWCFCANQKNELKSTGADVKTMVLSRKTAKW